MTPFPQELLVAVAGHSVSAFLMLSVGIFVLAQNWRKLENRLFFFMTLSTFAYEIFYIVASLQTSYDAAYFWWSLNIVDIFIPIAVAHFILRVSNRDHAWRWFIRCIYAFGVIVLIVARIMPEWFLPNVLPKLYFIYYLNGGWLYAVMVAFVLIVPLIAVTSLIRAYRQSIGIERQRLEYFLLMLIIGYAGGINFLPALNIFLVDPIIGAPMGLYLLPIAYGIFSSDLLDIRIVARRALYYALAIGTITAFLVALVLLNTVLAQAIPGLQFWMLPFFVAFVAFAIGRTVLWQFKESDRLKYEFITVATHKLRTPLTQIRWSIAELLDRGNTDAEERESLLRIDNANNRLIELTNDLIETAHSGEAAVIEKSPVALTPLVNETLARFKEQITQKKLSVSTVMDETLLMLGEVRRVSSVIDVLIENAVEYTPPSGTIVVRTAPDEHGVRFSVTDNGMGVAPEDRDRIFSGFFRADTAKTTDTEGMGLGLSLVKSIVERLGGRTGFDSPGVGQGSTFWFVLPKA